MVKNKDFGLNGLKMGAKNQKSTIKMAKDMVFGLIIGAKVVIKNQKLGMRMAAIKVLIDLGMKMDKNIKKHSSWR